MANIASLMSLAGALGIRNATLTGGKAIEGGAIRMRNGAEATIERSTFSANSAMHGGAIATSSSDDKLSVSDSRFTGNIAEKSAGAIYDKGGTVSISNSVFEKNCAQFAFFTLAEGVNSERHSLDAEGCHRVRYVRSQIEAELQSHVDGGAIRLLNGAQVSIEDSSFSGNSATYGGAISTASKDVELSVSGSGFVDNSTQEGDGGAIETTYSKLDIINSTFSENKAGDDGGAVKINENAEVTIAHATFVDNWSDEHQANAISKTGGKAYLRNSIVTSEADGEDCVGAWEHAGNLSTDGTCADRRRRSAAGRLDRLAGLLPAARQEPGG
jgi:predicted outer membrane repeat protein